MKLKKLILCSVVALGMISMSHQIAVVSVCADDIKPVLNELDETADPEINVDADLIIEEEPNELTEDECAMTGDEMLQDVSDDPARVDANAEEYSGEIDFNEDSDTCSESDALGTVALRGSGTITDPWKISTNTVIDNTVPETADHYYRFELTQYGFIQPLASVTGNNGTTWNHLNIYSESVSNSNLVFCFEGINKTSLYNVGKVGLKPGTYIVHAKMGNATGYSFNIKFTQSDRYEEEIDSPASPKKIVADGKLYYGETNNSYGDTADYYYFTLAQKEKVTVYAKSDENYYLNVGIFSDPACNGKIKDASNDSFTYSVALEAGTYYVKVTNGLSATEHYGYQFSISGKKPATYKIKYAMAGGINNPANPKNYTYGETIELLAPEERLGYDFAGWFSNKKKTKSAVGILPDTKGNKTFYAKWTKIPYTITYELDGGTNHKKNKTSYNITTKTFKLNKPKKAGYTFIGWFDSPDDNANKVTKISKGSYGDKTLYAHWQLDEYPITYKLKGGSFAGEVVSKYTINDDTIILPVPTREGYDFVGWYKSSKLKGSPVTEITSGSTGKKTLYAKWKKKTQ